MGFFNRRKEEIKEFFKPSIAILQKVRPIFKTVDGIEHFGSNYKWANSSGLVRTVGDFAMINIDSNGYIKDENGIMYPLSNVISIKWEIIKEKKVIDNFSSSYQIFFSNDEVEKMQEVLKEEVESKNE